VNAIYQVSVNPHQPNQSDVYAKPLHHRHLLRHHRDRDGLLPLNLLQSGRGPPVPLHPRSRDRQREALRGPLPIGLQTDPFLPPRMPRDRAHRRPRLRPSQDGPRPERPLLPNPQGTPRCRGPRQPVLRTERVHRRPGDLRLPQPRREALQGGDQTLYRRCRGVHAAALRRGRQRRRTVKGGVRPRTRTDRHPGRPRRGAGEILEVIPSGAGEGGIPHRAADDVPA